MDTALAQKFPFILDRNLAKANCTGNHVCTSCDTVVLGLHIRRAWRTQPLGKIKYAELNILIFCKLVTTKST